MIDLKTEDEFLSESSEPRNVCSFCDQYTNELIEVNIVHGGLIEFVSEPATAEGRMDGDTKLTTTMAMLVDVVQKLGDEPEFMYPRKYEDYTKADHVKNIGSIIWNKLEWADKNDGHAQPKYLSLPDGGTYRVTFELQKGEAQQFVDGITKIQKEHRLDIGLDGHSILREFAQGKPDMRIDIEAFKSGAEYARKDYGMAFYDEREHLQTYSNDELEMLRQITLARMNRPGHNPDSVSPANNDNRVTLKCIKEILDLRNQHAEDIGNDVAMERFEEKFNGSKQDG